MNGDGGFGPTPNRPVWSKEMYLALYREVEELKQKKNELQNKLQEWGECQQMFRIWGGSDVIESTDTCFKIKFLPHYHGKCYGEYEAVFEKNGRFWSLSDHKLPYSIMDFRKRVEEARINTFDQLSTLIKCLQHEIYLFILRQEQFKEAKSLHSHSIEIYPSGNTLEVSLTIRVNDCAGSDLCSVNVKLNYNSDMYLPRNVLFMFKGGDSDVDSEARSEFRNQLSTLKILPLKDAIMSAFSMESPTKEMESKLGFKSPPVSIEGSTAALQKQPLSRVPSFSNDISQNPSARTQITGPVGSQQLPNFSQSTRSTESASKEMESNLGFKSPPSGIEAARLKQPLLRVPPFSNDINSSQNPSARTQIQAEPLPSQQLPNFSQFACPPPARNEESAGLLPNPSFPHFSPFIHPPPLRSEVSTGPLPSQQPSGFFRPSYSSNFNQNHIAMSDVSEVALSSQPSFNNPTCILPPSVGMNGQGAVVPSLLPSKFYPPSNNGIYHQNSSARMEEYNNNNFDPSVAIQVPTTATNRPSVKSRLGPRIPIQGNKKRKGGWRKKK